jgi:hypothetical protein
MTVTLNRPYFGYASGTVVTLPSASEEAALIAQGGAVTAAVANTTTGAVTANLISGTAAFAIGAASLVITNALVDANSVINAYVSQAAADGTLLRVERIVAAAGSFTIYGTAAATAVTLVKWYVEVPGGLKPVL